MVLKILSGLILLAAVLVAVIATRPAEFRITRTATIAAPAAVVFEQINDLHRFNDWSPWAKLDPNAKNTFDGPPAGVGASFAWDGNNEVGAGRMTITQSRPGDRIWMKLEFTKPFEATNSTEFTFTPLGDRTEVTWTMAGINNFIAKGVGLFMDCDKMVGGQFEQGFANLNALVTAKPTLQP